MKYILPRNYLSYSAISLWIKSKDQFRKKYYENDASFETIETLYGKQIAEMLEDRDIVDNHPILKLIPKHSHAEYPIKVEIEGIPIKGYLDNFCPRKKSFKEFKTGHVNREGRSPWNQKKVDKHLQLPFYSLLIEENYGDVDDKCQLIWIETQFKEKSVEFMGIKLIADSRELELTGKIEVFDRVITKEERQETRDLIIKIAKEIADDYENYTRNK